jgi:hypothetical protein
VRTSVAGTGRGVERIERHDRFPAGDHVLNKGRRVPLGPNGESCSWAMDCTSRIDCGGGSVMYCNRMEQDTSDIELQIYETNDRVVLERKTAICVDYDGDTEVLCEIAYLNDSLGHSYRSVSGRRDYRARFETQCDGSLLDTSNESGDHVEVHASQWLSPGAGLRTLRLGSLEIVLKGDEIEHGHDETVDYQTVNGLRLAPVGSVHEFHASRNVKARLLYVDAREQTVVYETEEARIRQDISSNIPAVDGSWQEIQATSRDTALTETVAYVMGQRYSLAREESPPNEVLIQGVLLEHGPIPVRQCHNEPSEVVDVQEGALTDASDWTALIHPRANDPSQGYAIDHDGDYVVSQPLWQPSGSSFVRVGTWNAISDGDLDALVPGVANGGTFGEVKLLE